MALVGVFVVVQQASGFQATMDVVMVALIELDGVCHDRIGAADAIVPVGQRAVVGADAVDLFAQGLAVEDVVVLAQAQVVQPRTQLGLIKTDAAIGFN